MFGGEPFFFREVCWRSEGRIDMRFQPGDPMLRRLLRTLSFDGATAATPAASPSTRLTAEAPSAAPAGNEPNEPAAQQSFWSSALVALVRAALGPDAKLLWAGVVLSRPGSEGLWEGSLSGGAAVRAREEPKVGAIAGRRGGAAGSACNRARHCVAPAPPSQPIRLTPGQPWHTDGDHLFPPSASSGSGAPVLVPPHALNVFIPLVDLSPAIGPTRFLPASHHLARLRPCAPRPRLLARACATCSLGLDGVCLPARGATPLSTGHRRGPLLAEDGVFWSGSVCEGRRCCGLRLPHGASGHMQPHRAGPAAHVPHIRASMVYGHGQFPRDVDLGLMCVAEAAS